MRPNGAAYRRLPVVPRLPDLVSDRWRPAEWNSARTGKVRPGIAPRDVIRPGAHDEVDAAAHDVRARAAACKLGLARAAAPPTRSPAWRSRAGSSSGCTTCRSVSARTFSPRNQQVYETMWGPSEFFATGVLKDWNVESRLGELDVPTLILSAATTRRRRHSSDVCRRASGDRARTMLENSAHLTFLEEPEPLRRDPDVASRRH